MSTISPDAVDDATSAESISSSIWLTGTTGEVTTLDINADVTAGARRNLDETGFGHVGVITRDGAEGAAEHGPYDRIIVTVGAWDILRAWWDQLVSGGRLVLPLRWRGTTSAVAFIKRNDHFDSDCVVARRDRWRPTRCRGTPT